MPQLVTNGVVNTTGIQLKDLRGADPRINAPYAVQASSDPDPAVLQLQVSQNGANWDDLHGATLRDGNGRWNIYFTLPLACWVRIDPTTIGAFSGDVDIA